MPKMITANRLGDGEVVYLTRDGGWSARFGEGHAFDGEAEEDRLLSVAAKAEAELAIVVPYAMEVASVEDGVAPLSQRERIRAQGPTVSAERRQRAAAAARGQG